MPADDRMTGVVLETSAKCQFGCPLCFLRSYTERPEPALMPLAVAKAVAPYLSSLESIDLTGWGEPLLNPEFFDIVELVRGVFKGRLSMTTNGVLVDDRAAGRIAQNELDVVCVSMDAASEKTYLKARPGGDFPSLLKALARLVAARDRSAKRKPLIFSAFLLKKDSLAELADFVRLAAGRGLDGVVFQMLTGVFSERGLNAVTHADYYRNRFDRAALDDALAAARKAAPGGFIIAGPECIGPERVGGCGGFDLSRPFITSSGLVSVCCAMAYPCALMRRDGRVEKTESYFFGDVLKAPLPEIWRDPFYVRTREDIHSGKIPAACGDCIALYMRPGQAWTAP